MNRTIGTMNKRAAMSFYKDTLEYLFIAVLIMGFLLAIFIRSALVSYVIIIIVGLMVGRQFYFKQKNLPLSRYVLAFAFVIGFMVGSFYASWLWLAFFFVVGAYSGFQLHKHKIINELE